MPRGPSKKDFSVKNHDLASIVKKVLGERSSDALFSLKAALPPLKTKYIFERPSGAENTARRIYEKLNEEKYYCTYISVQPGNPSHQIYKIYPIGSTSPQGQPLFIFELYKATKPYFVACNFGSSKNKTTFEKYAEEFAKKFGGVLEQKQRSQR